MDNRITVRDRKNSSEKITRSYTSPLNKQLDEFGYVTKDSQIFPKFLRNNTNYP